MSRTHPQMLVSRLGKVESAHVVVRMIRAGECDSVVNTPAPECRREINLGVSQVTRMVPSTSCAVSRIKNCIGTRMDGDNDGIPCESK